MIQVHYMIRWHMVERRETFRHDGYFHTKLTCECGETQVSQYDLGVDIWLKGHQPIKYVRLDYRYWMDVD